MVWLIFPQSCATESQVLIKQLAAALNEIIFSDQTNFK